MTLTGQESDQQLTDYFSSEERHIMRPDDQVVNRVKDYFTKNYPNLPRQAVLFLWNHWMESAPAELLFEDTSFNVALALLAQALGEQIPSKNENPMIAELLESNKVLYEPFMPAPLPIGIHSIMQDKVVAMVDSPIIHAWVFRNAASQIERVLMIGQGLPEIQARIFPLAVQTCLRAHASPTNFLNIGAYHIQIHGAHIPDLNLPVNLIEPAIPAGQALQTAQEAIQRLVAELRLIENQTALVQIHEYRMDDLIGLRTSLTGCEQEAVDSNHATLWVPAYNNADPAEMATVEPLRHLPGGQMLHVTIHKDLFETKSYEHLLDAYQYATIEKVRATTRKRIKMYQARADHHEKLVREYNNPKTRASVLQKLGPTVTLEATFDPEKGIWLPSPPTQMSTEKWLEGLPGMIKNLRTWQMQMWDILVSYELVADCGRKIQGDVENRRDEYQMRRDELAEVERKYQDPKTRQEVEVTDEFDDDLGMFIPCMRKEKQEDIDQLVQVDIPRMKQELKMWKQKMNVILQDIDALTQASAGRHDSPIERLAYSTFLDAAIRGRTFDGSAMVKDAFETWCIEVQPHLCFMWLQSLQERGIAVEDIAKSNILFHAMLGDNQSVVMGAYAVIDQQRSCILFDSERHVTVVLDSTNDHDTEQTLTPPDFRRQWASLQNIADRLIETERGFRREIENAQLPQSAFTEGWQELRETFGITAVERSFQQQLQETLSTNPNGLIQKLWDYLGHVPINNERPSAGPGVTRQRPASFEELLASYKGAESEGQVSADEGLEGVSAIEQALRQVAEMLRVTRSFQCALRAWILDARIARNQYVDMLTSAHEAEWCVRGHILAAIFAWGDSLGIHTADSSNLAERKEFLPNLSDDFRAEYKRAIIPLPGAIEGMVTALENAKRVAPRYLENWQGFLGHMNVMAAIDQLQVGLPDIRTAVAHTMELSALKGRSAVEAAYIARELRRCAQSLAEDEEFVYSALVKLGPVVEQGLLAKYMDPHMELRELLEMLIGDRSPKI